MELAAFHDDRGRGRGCQPVSSRSPGATETLRAFPCWSRLRLASDIQPSWLGDLMDPALPSERRRICRRHGAQRQRASPLTPLE